MDDALELEDVFQQEVDETDGRLRLNFFVLLVDLGILLLLLFREHCGLGLEDGQFVVSRSILLQLVLEHHAVPLELLHVVGQPLQLRLRRHRLLQKKFGPLQALPLVIELSAEDFVVQLTILPRLNA